VVLRHDSSFDASSIEVVESRTARFLSVRLTLRATGEAQLKALFADLKATGRVHMVV
jgi:putative lipoic acid-binding regulatory protein